MRTSGSPGAPGGNPRGHPVDAQGVVYVGGWDAQLYAIGPDGAERWRLAMPQSIISSSVAIGADGTVYVGCMDHCLYAVGE